MTSTIPQFHRHQVGPVTVECNPLSAGGFQVRATEQGVCFYAKHHAFEAPAVNDYRRLVATYTPDELAEGGTVTDRIGDTTVTTQCVRPGVYAVRTEQGCFRIEAFCWSYGDLREAYQAQAHALAAFARYGTVDAIEARTAHLVPELMRLTGRRGATARRDERAVSLELYGLATLADRAGLADIADDIARLNAA